MIHAARGGVSLVTNSSRDAVPVAPSSSRGRTWAGVWSKTTHSWPWRMSRRTRFAPMRPSPIMPSCIGASLPRFPVCGCQALTLVDPAYPSPPGRGIVTIPEMDDQSHVRRNRVVWDRIAPAYEEAGRRNWATGEARWGIWGIPETEAHLLPSLEGRDVVELGCGTAYVSSWVARRGGRP